MPTSANASGLIVTQRATLDVEQLNAQFNQLLQQLGPLAGAKLITNVSVGTAVTSIPHGQRGKKPRDVLVMPYANVMPYRPQVPDTQFIYLQASSPTTCSVWVIP